MQTSLHLLARGSSWLVSGTLMVMLMASVCITNLIVRFSVFCDLHLFMFMGVDTSTFFSITPSGHFVVRKLRLLPRVPHMEVSASEAQTLPSLPLPNPFKVMKSRHDQIPPGGKDRVAGRIAVDEETDLGPLLLGGSLSGLRTRRTEGGMIMSGIAWSPQQLSVSNLPLSSASCDVSFRYSTTMMGPFVYHSLILWST